MTTKFHGAGRFASCGLALSVAFVLASCATPSPGGGTTDATTTDAAISDTSTAPVPDLCPAPAPSPDPEVTQTPEESTARYKQFTADYAWQGGIAELLDRAKALDPDNFTTAEFGDHTFSMTFRGPATPGAKAILGESAIPHTIIENAGYNDADLTELSRLVGERLTAIVPAGLSWSAGVSAQTRTISADVLLGDELTANRDLCATMNPASITARLEQSLADVDTLGFPVVVYTGWGENRADTSAAGD